MISQSSIRKMSPKYPEKDWKRLFHPGAISGNLHKATDNKVIYTKFIGGCSDNSIFFDISRLEVDVFPYTHV